MASTLSVFARASTSVGSWDGGDVKVCDSTLADVGDLKKAIAREMNRSSSDILSLHPVGAYQALKKLAPLLLDALPELSGDALLTDPAVASHIVSSGCGDSQRLYLIALLSPMEGACWGAGCSSGESYGCSPSTIHFPGALSTVAGAGSGEFG